MDLAKNDVIRTPPSFLVGYIEFPPCASLKSSVCLGLEPKGLIVDWVCAKGLFLYVICPCFGQGLFGVLCN